MKEGREYMREWVGMWCARFVASGPESFKNFKRWIGLSTRLSWLVKPRDLTYGFEILFVFWAYYLIYLPNSSHFLCTN